MYFAVASAKIDKGPPNQTVKPGSTITLTAKISGDPEPDVSLKDDFMKYLKAVNFYKIDLTKMVTAQKNEIRTVV